MSEWIIYYNPKCGTCRKTLDLLRQHKIEPEIIEYLKDPLSESEVDALLKKLKKEPRELARSKEPIYSQLRLGTGQPSRAEWLKAMAAHPILIERPVVVRGNRAVIARPPERIQELL